METSTVFSMGAQKRIEVQNNNIERALWQTCLNCDFWRKDIERCEKFQARPPAVVIVVGCVHHLDEIPF